MRGLMKYRLTKNLIRQEFEYPIPAVVGYSKYLILF